MSDLKDALSVAEQLHPPVPIKTMRTALTAFCATVQRCKPEDRKRFKKAEVAVYKATEDAGHREQFSCFGRCHAFRNLTNKYPAKAFERWLLPGTNGEEPHFHDAFIDAVAVTPMRGGGTRFLKTDFMAAVEKIASENYGYAGIVQKKTRSR